MNEIEVEIIYINYRVLVIFNSINKCIAIAVISENHIL